MTEGKLQWHPAFIAALHIEFEDELDILEIESEHQLSKKPIQADALIIKKKKDTPVQKNIGRIFRKYNIIEYKSPEDSLCINDFYKVYAYTCLYQSDTKEVNQREPGELTITYVCNRYPRKMLKQLKDGRHLTVEKKSKGIYYLNGDEFPIQIIITKELSKEENYWLQSLRNNLKAGSEIEDLAERYEPKRQNTYYQAVMDLLVRANQEEMEEAKGMCNAILELFADEFEEKKKEVMEQAREEGLAQGELRTKKIFKLFALGTSIEQIAEKCDVSVEKVMQILE